jgi:hypothetical protein
MQSSPTESGEVVRRNGNDGAVFSPCLRYRYRLWRSWGQAGRIANFIMLNPSTADENVLDPTVARCLKRAQRLGCSDLIVTNLFAMRSTDPSRLYTATDPVGPLNGSHLISSAVRAHESGGYVILGWGKHGALHDRGRKLVEVLRALKIRMHALHINKDGSPKHPLYVADAKELEVVQ